MDTRQDSWVAQTLDESLFESVEQEEAGRFDPADKTPPSKRTYVPLQVKFALACAIAAAWTGLSVWLSFPWVKDLAEVTNFTFTVIVITFIAYVPGFMTAFLLSTLAMDRKPSRIKPAVYSASFAAEVGTLFPNDPVTHEIIRLELALDDAQTAADRSPLTRGMFVDLDWDHVALTNASGGQVLRQSSNAAQIWSALTRAENPPVAKSADVPMDILVWRSHWDPCFRVLDADEAELFAQMTSPLAFTDICIQLEQKLGEQAALERAGLLLARWADDEAVSIAS